MDPSIQLGELGRYGPDEITDTRVRGLANAMRVSELASIAHAETSSVVLKANLVRAIAIRGGRVTSESSAALAALDSLATNSSAVVRVAVADALSAQPRLVSKAENTLMRLSKDPNPSVARAAIEALEIE